MQRLHPHLAAASLAALSLLSPPASAALITESLTGTVILGPFAGTQGSGSFTYDDTSLAGSGIEFLTPADGLTLTFTIFGQTFQETNDVDYDFFPELTFEDGVPAFLDFVVDENHPDNPTPINDPDVFNFVVLSSLLGAPGAGFDAEVEVNVIPEPSAVGFAAVAGIGLGAFAFGRRVRRRAA